MKRMHSAIPRMGRLFLLLLTVMALPLAGAERPDAPGRTEQKEALEAIRKEFATNYNALRYVNPIDGKGQDLSVKELRDMLASLRRAPSDLRERDERIRRCQSSLNACFTLSRQLLGRARTAEAGSARQWVLLDQAHDGAMAIDDIRSVIAIGEIRSRHFAVDRFDHWQENLRSLEKHLDTPLAGQMGRLVLSWLDLSRVATAEGETAIAVRALRAAKKVAKKSDDKGLSDLIELLDKEQDRRKRETREYDRAKQVLLKKPEDPESNRTVGRYLALNLADWNTALQFLVRAGEDPLAEIARRDRTAPESAEDRSALAEAYWTQATKEEDPAAANALRLRAAHWYALAEPKLKGQDLSRARTRQETAQLASRDLRPGLIATWYSKQELRDHDKIRSERMLCTPVIKWESGQADVGLPRSNWYLSLQGMIRIPESGSYSFYLAADDGFRLTLAGKNIAEDWKNGSLRWGSGQAELKAGLHPIRIDLRQGSGPAEIRVLYALGKMEREAIPLSWLYHDHEQAIRTGAVDQIHTKKKPQGDAPKTPAPPPVEETTPKAPEKQPDGKDVPKLPSRVLQLQEQLVWGNRLGRNLQLATKGKDHSTIAKILLIDRNDAKSISKGQAPVYDKLGILWLYKAVSQPGLQLLPAGVRMHKSLPLLDVTIASETPGETTTHSLAIVRRGRSGTSYSLRPLHLKEQQEQQALQMTDFWRAVEEAEYLAIATPVAEEKQADRLSLKVLKLEPTYRELANPTHAIPSGMHHTFRRELRYLVPFVPGAVDLKVIPGAYRCPVLTRETIDPILKGAVEYLKSKGDQRGAILRGFFRNRDCQTVQADALAALRRQGEFAAPFTTAERLAFWCAAARNRDLSPQTRQTLLEALAENNFELCREVFQDALTTPGLEQTAAALFCRRDRKAFRELLIRWLKDPGQQRRALRLAGALKGDPEFLQPLMEAFKKAGDALFHAFRPYLLASGNEAGQTWIEHTLREGRNPLQLIPLLEAITEERDRRFLEAVRAGILRLDRSTHADADDAQAARMITFHGLAYLASLGDGKGIRMALKVLEVVQNQPDLRLALMLPLGRAAQRNFAAVADCRIWLKNQIPDKKK